MVESGDQNAAAGRPGHRDSPEFLVIALPIECNPLPAPVPRRLRVRRPLISLCALLALAFGVASASTTPTVSEYVGGDEPIDATAGPDGNVWVVELGSNQIARVTPTGSITEFSSGLRANAGLAGIAAGPDGNLWFTESLANRIGRITPAGTITEFAAGISPGSAPHGIALGGDGNLWFTETAGNRIGRITPAGAVSEFSTGIRTASAPWGIAAGLDGNLWFTQHVAPGRVARITTAGIVTEYGTTSGMPAGIAAGPDGNVWFVETASPARIGRISPAGTITEFTNGLTKDAAPEDITSADDGRLYFTEAKDNGALGQITASGAIKEFAVSLRKAPFAITTGSDGNIWFTEPNGDRVGRMTIAPLAATSVPALTSDTGATLAGQVGPNSQATSYHFEWGKTAIYGLNTPERDAGDAAPAAIVTEAITGLTVSETYHYRIVASNASGTTSGQDVTFIAGRPGTSPAPPVPPAARPVFGRSASIAPISGLVRVELPGRKRFVTLAAPSTVPVGTIVDSSNGVVRLTTVRTRGGPLQRGTFWGGSFTVRQARRRYAYTVLTLRAPTGCPVGKDRLLSAANPPRPKPHLWGRDSHGRFVTRGQTAVATVRGTTWLTRNTCRGTQIVVTRGAVSVRDLSRHRTIHLHAHESYLARRR